MQRFILRGLLNLSMLAFIGSRFRGRLLRLIGLNVHPSAQICRGVRLGGRNITFAAGSKANEERWIDENVFVERDVFIGPRVMILANTHNLAGPDRRRGYLDIARPIVIGRSSWIGAGAIISPGVKIARGCMVCPAAVVTKSTEPDGMYAGVPAVRKRELNNAPAVSPVAGFHLVPRLQAVCAG